MDAPPADAPEPPAASLNRCGRASGPPRIRWGCARGEDLLDRPVAAADRFDWDSDDGEAECAPGPEDEAADRPELCPPPPLPRGERRAWLAGFALGSAGLLATTALVGFALAYILGAAPPAILLVGLDLRPDEQQRGLPGHTDAISVLLWQPAGNATLVSFPRDLWVDIPGFGEQRLNVAYPLGAQTGGPPAGAALLARTLDGEFGLRADRWVQVDFRGFAAVVDALGGLDLVVPATIVDEHYPTDDYGSRRLVIPAGTQHLDGATALAYARTRAPDSDFGRMARQQQVLAALRERARSPAGVPLVPGALPALREAITTNLAPHEAVVVLSSLALLPRERLVSLVIGPELAPPRIGPGGAAILVPRNAAIRQALADALGPP